MALAKALLCLATEGGVDGAVVGVSYASGVGFMNSSLSPLEAKKEDFLRQLGEKAHCSLFYGLEDDKKFGTLYMCPEKVDREAKSILYYLEEESSFDWSKTYEELMAKDVFKEIKKFQYKSDESTGYYLLINFGEEGGDKMISLSAPSFQDWSAYSGFSKN